MCGCHKFASTGRNGELGTTSKACLWAVWDGCQQAKLCLKELAFVFFSVSNGKFWFNCLGTLSLLTNNGSMVMYSSWHLMMTWLIWWFLEILLLGFWVSLQLRYLEVLLVFLASSNMNKNEGSFVMSLCQYDTWIVIKCVIPANRKMVKLACWTDFLIIFYFGANLCLFF